MITIACRSILRACSLAVVMFVPAMPFAAHAQDQSPANTDGIAKMMRLMTEDGYSYKATKSSTVWAIHFTGKRINDIKVVLTIGGDADSDLIVFVTVVQKQYMPVNTDFMNSLLKMNHEIDQVKIGYDADGDLEVRTDTALRLADAQMLKHVVEQVKDASDEIYGRIQPSLVGDNPHPYDR
jgi:hypothetical protein